MFLIILRKICAVVTVIWWGFEAQKVYNAHSAELIEDLSNAGLLNAGDKKYTNRLQTYIIFHWIFCRLLMSFHHRRLKKEESDRIIYFSALAPIVDDIQDEWQVKLSPVTIKHVLRGNPHPQLSTEQNRLLQKYIQRSTNGLSKHSVSDIHKLAIAFLKANQDLSSPSNKGAITALLYRKILVLQLHKTEEKLIREIGSIGQFIDDIFDYYEDRQAKEKTMATKYTSIQQVEEAYKNKQGKLLINLKKNLGKQNKETAISTYYLTFLLHLAYVPLSQYKKYLADKYKLRRDLKRSEYICDMELKANRLRWIWSYLSSRP